MSQLTIHVPSRQGEPVWEVAELLPLQGKWSEAQYFSLTDSSRRLVEYADGVVKVLPMPKTSHQRIVMFLYEALLAFIRPRALGEALVAPLRVRLVAGQYREPDIVFMRRENFDRIGEDFWDGADWVTEVVSDDDPDRDLIVKRHEYAEAGIGEYWIVDPRRKVVIVLMLRGGIYQVHGEFAAGGRATSPMLTGFEIDVESLFNSQTNPGGLRP